MENIVNFFLLFCVILQIFGCSSSLLSILLCFSRDVYIYMFKFELFKLTEQQKLQQQNTEKTKWQ